ncbi:hypothetical protein GCM10023188_19080 [Pontibacter saemangeumensis]|uniref:Stress-response A/B barrel domain-containing protein n=1 Tax=Pontibacter saemangeumensis TaxID=1084525 RepID=A0ABP8LN07_9BACT
MKNLTMTLLAALLLGICSFFLSSAGHSKPGRLRHVVAFKFKPGVTPEQMAKVTGDFRDLKGKVPQILAFEGGPDVSLQKKSGGFTHCFIVTVRDEEALAAYGTHPDHQAFSKSADPLLAEVMVVDYLAE